MSAPPPSARRRKTGFDAAMIAALIAVALIITFPWIAHPLKTSIGSYDAAYDYAGGDYMRALVFGGWQRFAPLELHAWPLAETNFKIFPVGAAYGTSYDGLLLALMTGFFYCFTRLSMASNIALVLAFVVSGWFTYYACRRLFGRGVAAVYAGLSAACLPYIIQRAPTHSNLCLVWVVPLAMHLFFNFAAKPTLKRALIWGLSIPLMAASSWYVLMMGLPFQLALCLGLLIERKRQDRDLKLVLRRMFCGAALGGAGVLLLAAPMLMHARGRVNAGPGDMALFSVPLAQYFMPHPESALGHVSAVARLQEKIGTHWEGMGGGPVAAILLSLVFLTRLGPRRRRWTFGLIAVFMLLLACGPRLKIFELQPLDSGLKLPLYYLQRLSARFNNIRHPGRMHSALMYACIVASALTLQHWLVRAKNQRRRRVVQGLAIAALAFNVLWSARLGGYPVYPRIMMPAWYETVGRENPPPSERGAIIDVPASYYYFSIYDYYQLTHGRPIVFSSSFYHDGLRAENLKFFWDSPLLPFFLEDAGANAAYVNQGVADRIAAPDFMNWLAANKIEYVVVHPKLLRFALDRGIAAPHLNEYYEQIQMAWQDRLIFEDENIRVYHTGTKINQREKQ